MDQKMAVQDILQGSKKTLEKHVVQQNKQYGNTIFKRAIEEMGKKFLNFFDTYIEYDRMFLKRDVNFIEVNIKQSFAIHKNPELEQFLKLFKTIADESLSLYQES